MLQSTSGYLQNLIHLLHGLRWFCSNAGSKLQTRLPGRDDDRLTFEAHVLKGPYVVLSRFQVTHCGWRMLQDENE